MTEAGCVNLSDNNTWWMKIYNNSGVLTLIGNTTLCRDVYTDLPISIPSDNLQLDCGGALLKGLGSGNAVIISGQNVLVENCIIKTYGVGISSSSNGLTIINNSIFNNTDYGLNLGGDNLNISHNYVYNSSHAASTYNIFSDGDNLNFSNNVIVLSYDSCLAADGNNNVFINNSAYYCDLQSLNGGAFEIGGTNHLIMYNHAENSSNGLYIEGRYNNITNNTVQGNILGINLLGYGNRVYNNTANESLMADLIIGGDLWLNLDFIGGGVMVIPPTACNNDIQDLTGSGGRPIFFSNSTVNIQNAVYSEVVLCGADGAV